MNLKNIALVIICISAISITGCTTHPSEPAGTPTVPVSWSQPIPATTVAVPRPEECTRADDCVPAECCHPSRCTAMAAKQPCNLMCTESCEGPLDCGAGRCGCVNGTCSVIAGSSASPGSLRTPSMTINVSPRRYSPIMSSTPGIGLEPQVTGSGTTGASFAWTASFGNFLSWNPPDFRVHELGNSTVNHGEKIYWSFLATPSSTTTPVTITVTAEDTTSGRPLGRSTITLVWEDHSWVNVSRIE